MGSGRGAPGRGRGRTRPRAPPRTEARSPLRRERPTGAEGRVHQLREVDSAHQLGGGEGLAGRDTELVHARDARVLERAVQSRRLGQLRRAIRFGDQLGVKPLDGKLPLEAGDPVDLGAKYLPVGPPPRGSARWYLPRRRPVAPAPE